MHPAPFDYFAPESLDEAVGLLHRYGDEAKVLAGGQSLIPMMNLRLLQPAYLIDINGLGNGTPQHRKGAVTIPALTRQRAIERDGIVRSRCPVIADSIGFIGNVRVRSRGTVGGNLAHADPSSELAVAGLASGGSVTVRGTNGSRDISLDDLFVTYLTTSLEPSELITEIHVPVMQPNSGWAFVEMARRAGEFAIVNVAALMTLDGSTQRVKAVSLALGGVSDRPISMTSQISELVVGSDSRSFTAAADKAASLVEPRDDVHASGEYRREMVRVYVKRALDLARQRAERSRSA